MAQEFWIPGIGLAHFGDEVYGAELEDMIEKLCRLPLEERSQHFDDFRYEDAGVSVSGRFCTLAPFSNIDISSLMASAARRLQSATEFRVKQFKQTGAFVLVPNTATICGTCIACGDPLPTGDLLGRCEACKRATRLLIFEDDTIALAHGVN